MGDWVTSDHVVHDHVEGAKARDSATRRLMEANARALRRSGGRVEALVPDDRETPEPSCET